MMGHETQQDEPMALLLNNTAGEVPSTPGSQQLALIRSSGAPSTFLVFPTLALEISSRFRLRRLQRLSRIARCVPGADMYRMH